MKPLKNKIAGYFLPLLIVGIFAVGIPSNTALSLEDERDSIHDEEGNINVVECFRRGGIDFVTFINEAIWGEGFTGIKEDWRDVLFRNQCHALDVLALIKKRDSIRKQIRNAFLTCNNDKVPKLKESYYKTSMEIDYARSVVDYETKEEISRNQLYKQLEDKYISKPVGDFDNLFLLIENKYRERKESYSMCEKGSWQAVVERWHELEEYFNELAEESNRAIANQAKKIEKLGNDLGSQSFGDWAKNLVKTNINGLSPEDFAEEFLEEWNDKYAFYTEEFWTKGLSTDNVGSYLEASQAAGVTEDLAEIQANLDGKFKSLYLGTSDSAIKAMVKEVEVLNTTVLDSIKTLGGVEKCTKDINDRQC